MVRTKEITTPRLQYRCQSLSLPVGIQSPKLRMVSWNLNAVRFGGDYTTLAHHLTRWARILRGHVRPRKPRCPLEKGPFWWKDSKLLRGDILISSFSGKQKIRGGNVTTSKLASWIFCNQRTVPLPVFFFPMDDMCEAPGWWLWRTPIIPHHFPPHSWCVRSFGRMFCGQNYQFRYVWVDITWRFFHSDNLNWVEICHTSNDL